MRLIETQHSRVPWRAVFLLGLIGVALSVGHFAAGSMIFTMRKFISSPMVLNSIGSLDVLFNILIAATVLYVSDRVWTRHGRRKIFIAPAWLLMACCLFFLPLVNSAWTVALVVVLWLVLIDASSGFTVLQMEIVPPEQRGRFMAMNQWFFQVFLMVWMVVAGGRFDDVVLQEGFKLSGERFINWLGAGALIVAAFCLWFFVHERPPLVPPPPRDPDGPLRGAWRSIFAERALWPVYLLIFSQTLLTAGLGYVEPLLFTEQWGYSKQDMGTNIFVGGVINLFFIPLVGWLVDKVDRMKMFAIGVVGSFVLMVAYYFFIVFWLPDQRPSIFHMIVFGQLSSMCAQFRVIAFTPLMFDFIPRDKMGASQAGVNFLSSITRLLTLNGAGMWVTVYSYYFSPPGTFNYLSGFQFIMVMQILGLAFLAYFAVQVRRGAIRPLGKMERAEPASMTTVP